MKIKQGLIEGDERDFSMKWEGIEKNIEFLSLIPDSINQTFLNAKETTVITNENYREHLLNFSEEITNSYIYVKGRNSISNPDYENNSLFDPQFALDYGEEQQQNSDIYIIAQEFYTKHLDFLYLVYSIENRLLSLDLSG